MIVVVVVVASERAISEGKTNQQRLFAHKPKLPGCLEPLIIRPASIMSRVERRKEKRERRKDRKKERGRERKKVRKRERKKKRKKERRKSFYRDFS